MLLISIRGVRDICEEAQKPAIYPPIGTNEESQSKPVESLGSVAELLRNFDLWASFPPLPKSQGTFKARDQVILNSGLTLGVWTRDSGYLWVPQSLYTISFVFNRFEDVIWRLWDKVE